MPILLDEQPVEFQAQELGAVLQEAHDKVAAEGRLIVEVAIDGRVLPSHEIEQLAHVPTVAVTVGLKTENAKDLALDTLDQARQQLDNIRDLQEDAAECLQEDNTTEGFEHLGKLIQQWLQTQQAVVSVVRLMHVDLTDMAIDDMPIGELTDATVQQLIQLKEALEAGDTVSISDALAYEWPEQVDRWEKLLLVVAETIEPTQRPA